MKRLWTNNFIERSTSLSYKSALNNKRLKPPISLFLWKDSKTIMSEINCYDRITFNGTFNSVYKRSLELLIVGYICAHDVITSTISFRVSRLYCCYVLFQILLKLIFKSHSDVMGNCAYILPVDGTYWAAFGTQRFIAVYIVWYIYIYLCVYIIYTWVYNMV